MLGFGALDDPYEPQLAVSMMAARASRGRLHRCCIDIKLAVTAATSHERTPRPPKFVSQRGCGDVTNARVRTSAAPNSANEAIAGSRRLTIIRQSEIVPEAGAKGEVRNRWDSHGLSDKVSHKQAEARLWSKRVCKPPRGPLFARHQRPETLFVACKGKRDVVSFS